MSFVLSWLHVHGALTHFPVALLLTAVVFDIAALLFPRPMWRVISLALLVGAVLMSPPALLTGYLAGRAFPHPPVGFQQHWIAAVITSVLALILLLWRVLLRDQLTPGPRLAALLLLLICAATVSYTGYMGGIMVFGGADTGSQAGTGAAEDPERAAGRLELAAGKLELAAGRLDLSTERLAMASAKRLPARPETAGTRRAQPTARPPEPVGKLELAADKLGQAADKLDQVVTRMASAEARGAGKSGAAASVPAPRPAADARLVSAGEILFRSDATGCVACHSVGGRGGKSGPDLTHEARSHDDKEWQIKHLKSPSSLVKGSSMPPYDKLTANQLQALAAYLITRR